MRVPWRSRAADGLRPPTRGRARPEESRPLAPRGFETPPTAWLPRRRSEVRFDDAEPVGRLRVADAMRLTVDHELAVVGMDDAGQDLHQRGLACSVLTDEGMHGPRLDREADVRHRLDAPVALPDAAELHNRKGT